MNLYDPLWLNILSDLKTMGLSLSVYVPHQSTHPVLELLNF